MDTDIHGEINCRTQIVQGAASAEELGIDHLTIRIWKAFGEGHRLCSAVLRLHLPHQACRATAASPTAASPTGKPGAARTEAPPSLKSSDRPWRRSCLAPSANDVKPPSVADLCDRFVSDYLPRKRPSTQASYRQQIETEIRPALGKLKVAEVVYADVDRLHRAISKRAPYRANRCIALLSRMFSLSIRWHMRTDNPCKGIEKNQEHKRRRYLSAEELGRLTLALATAKDQQAADIVRMLLLTGARRGEVLTAKWADINLATGTWSKPAATTKTNSEHQVPLSAAARALLTGLRGRSPAEAVYLFPAR